jgi:hypothetical protein
MQARPLFSLSADGATANHLIPNYEPYVGAATHAHHHPTIHSYAIAQPYNQQLFDAYQSELQLASGAQVGICGARLAVLWAIGS